MTGEGFEVVDATGEPVGFLAAVAEHRPDAAVVDVREPLEGIPILLKDTMNTADRKPTTAGSTVLLGARLSRWTRFSSSS